MSHKRLRLADPTALVLDAPLTDLGREQCQQLHERTESNIQQEAELIVVSPVSHCMGQVKPCF